MASHKIQLPCHKHTQLQTVARLTYLLLLYLTHTHRRTQRVFARSVHFAVMLDDFTVSVFLAIHSVTLCPALLQTAPMMLVDLDQD